MSADVADARTLLDDVSDSLEQAEPVPDTAVQVREIADRLGAATGRLPTVPDEMIADTVRGLRNTALRISALAMLQDARPDGSSSPAVVVAQDALRDAVETARSQCADVVSALN